LATFVALVHAPICACRSHIIGADTTWGPALGCALCGLSLLLEKAARRRLIAMCVANVIADTC